MVVLVDSWATNNRITKMLTFIMGDYSLTVSLTVTTFVACFGGYIGWTFAGILFAHVSVCIVYSLIVCVLVDTRGIATTEGQMQATYPELRDQRGHSTQHGSRQSNPVTVWVQRCRAIVGSVRVVRHCLMFSQRWECEFLLLELAVIAWLLIFVYNISKELVHYVGSCWPRQEVLTTSHKATRTSHESSDSHTQPISIQPISSPALAVRAVASSQSRTQPTSSQLSTSRTVTSHQTSHPHSQPNSSQVTNSCTVISHQTSHPCTQSNSSQLATFCTVTSHQISHPHTQPNSSQLTTSCTVTSHQTSHLCIKPNHPKLSISCTVAPRQTSHPRTQPNSSQLSTCTVASPQAAYSSTQISFQMSTSTTSTEPSHALTRPKSSHILCPMAVISNKTPDSLTQPITSQMLTPRTTTPHHMLHPHTPPIVSGDVTTNSVASNKGNCDLLVTECAGRPDSPDEESNNEKMASSTFLLPELDKTGHNHHCTVPTAVPAPMLPQGYRYQRHVWFMCCDRCLYLTAKPEEYVIHCMNHACCMDILVVKQKGQHVWYRVRDRPSHLMPPNTKYCLCVYKQDGEQCFRDTLCWFGHSSIECDLWNRDMKATFNVSEFRSDCRSYLLSTICLACHDLISRSDPQTGDIPVLPIGDNYECRLGCFICVERHGDGETFEVDFTEHPCLRDVLLVRIPGEQQWWRVRVRGSQPMALRTSYKICKAVDSGRTCIKTVECWFAHSQIERELWELDRDGDEDFTVTQFVADLRRFDFPSKAADEGTKERFGQVSLHESLTSGSIDGGTRSVHVSQGGMQILNDKYLIDRDFNVDVQREVDAKKSSLCIQSGEIEKREDLRKKMVFTIDCKNTTDLENALSLQKTSKGYKLHIHTSDITFYVEKGSQVDKAANSRLASYFPYNNEPVHMFPEEFSVGCSSLLPNECRPTISVMLNLNQEYDVIEATIERCVISSKYNICHEDVENILNTKITHSDKIIQKTLPVLYDIAKTWSVQRTGRWPEATQVQNGYSAQKAYLIVQEMKSIANQVVADKLRGQASKGTANLPNETLGKRKGNYDISSENASLPELCTIPNMVWADLSNNIHAGKFEEASMLLNNLNASPALSDTGSDAHSNICPTPSDNLSMGHSASASSSQREYWCFTSPIRRYIDVAVHRVVVATILNQSEMPYTHRDLSELYDKCAKAVQRGKDYERDTTLLHMAAQLRVTPKVVLATVETIDENEMQLRFPCMVATQGRVSLSLLRPSDQPKSEKGHVTVKWRERVYNVESCMPPLPRSPQLPAEFSLTHVISRAEMQMLHSASATGNRTRIDDAWKQLQHIRTKNEFQEQDITSERKLVTTDGNVRSGHSEVSQLCDVSMSIQPGTPFMVQLTASALKPTLQLLRLTPTLDICLEHRISPVRCFTSSAPYRMSDDDDVERYRNSWIDTVAIEAAQTAVRSGETLIIHNVAIKWERHRNGVHGELKLRKDFCDERNLRLSRKSEERSYWYQDPDDPVNEPKRKLYFDYFCVRYPMTDKGSSLPSEISTSYRKIWVGHCVLSGISKNAHMWSRSENNHIYLSLKLQQHTNTIIPSELFSNEESLPKASVEYILKPVQHRREETALFNLPHASFLAKSLVNLSEDNEAQYVRENDTLLESVDHACLEGMEEPNKYQHQAINKALRHEFTLIQGPPGTGKTSTGVRLACLFSEINQKRLNDKDRQVMYCGPTNQSVDVVLKDYIKKSKRTDIVRIYSEIIEHKEYPMPFDDVEMENRRVKEYIVEEQLKKFALHRMIRVKGQCSDDLRKTIGSLDQKRERGYWSKTERKEYEKCIKSAKIEVLKKKKIIFCTCHSSCGPVVKRGTNISQLIIDECGMCTEPQSMVPIVFTEAEQVVLIGDHKQLKPIVIDAQARKLGLEQSMFERYCAKAQLLEIQYRMHEAIQAFPSKEFYDGALRCGIPSVQEKPSDLVDFWPNGPECPLAFVHAEGDEESFTVSTTEGNKQSKTNRYETEKAIEVASRLVCHHKVGAKNVMILSQYRAQCSHLKEKVRNSPQLSGVTVSTVFAAQGSECDYVILSVVRSLPVHEIDVPSGRNETWMMKNLGFIRDRNQMNVALTRAKKGLVIIGNKNLLVCDETWKKLVDDYGAQHAVVTAEHFPPPLPH